MSNAIGGGSFLNIVEEVASVALAAETGGASLAVTSAFSQVAEQAFTQAVGQLVENEVAQLATNAFSQAFSQELGSVAGQLAESAVQDLGQAVINAANHQGQNGAYTGGLDRQANDLSNMIQDNLVAAAKRNAIDKQGDGKGDSWLVAIAKAMGEMLGNIAQKEVALTDKMSGETGKSQASQFTADNSEFQAQAQMFQILSSTISTSIKAIGEGLSGIARKQ